MKYRWLLIFVLIFIFVLTPSCKKKDDQGGNEERELTEDEKIAQLLIDEYGTDHARVFFNKMDGSEYEMVKVQLGLTCSMPADPTRDGYTFEGWYVDKQFSKKYDFSTQVLQSIMLYAKWHEYSGKDYSFLLDEYVPDTATADFELPTEIDDYPDIDLTWKTSDENTINYYGEVFQGRTDLEVEVTMVVHGTERISYSKKVKVPAIEFDHIDRYKNRLIFGYYSTWNYNGFTEDQLKIDVINASFAYVNSDQTIDTRVMSAYFTKFLAARKHGVRVVLSIQGASNNTTNFSIAASTEENRKRFAKNVGELVDKYHFDGVDIDWEYPGWSKPDSKHYEAENFTNLIKEINIELKGRCSDYLVTAAIPGGPEGFKRYDLDQVSPYLDFIHLMTYDMEASSKTFHHTALYGTNGRTTGNQCSVDDSVELFNLKGVEYNKIVPGIAFYGKMTNPSSSTNGGLGSAAKDPSKSYQTITYTNIYNTYLKKVDNKNIFYYFDKECQAPYLYIKDSNLFITYDDETSIRAKCNYARAFDKEEVDRLGGVMIWELGEDRTGNLIKAVLSGMKRS